MERPESTRSEVPRSRSLDDGQLVARVLLRDSEPQAADDAYRVLVERHWKVVKVLARGRVRSERDAEDIAQEAFLKAFRSIDQLEDPRLFLGWLLRITQNLTTDHLRRRRHETSLEGLGLELDTASGEPRRGPATPTVSRASTSAEHEAQVELAEETRRALEAIGRLPEPYQNVLVLRYLQGYSNAEIARRLGEPDGTIRNRLFRALRKVRELLEARAPLKT